MPAAQIVLLPIALLAFALQRPTLLRPDPAIVCDACAEWNRPVEPFRIFGNTYYVGTEGLSALLVTSAEGHILLDGALPQSAPLIDANIRALGFRTEDVKLILNSHAHYDHAGGINALQRATGAEVAASETGAMALRAGGPTPDDPQIGFGREANAFPPVGRVKGVTDGERLRAGPLEITAHLTPGHTPGSTSWSWRSCEASQCLSLVYADSLTAVSAPGFRFSDGDLAERFRASILKVAALPCEIVVSTHPAATRVMEKRAKQREGGAPNPFVDARGCREYAGTAMKRLEARLAEERRDF